MKAREPGSNAAPTHDTSFGLLEIDPTARLSILQNVIVRSGKRCRAIVRGALEEGLDGTDEWRVDCADTGPWQVWFKPGDQTEVVHCSKVSCN